MQMRGYFGIGIVSGKCPENLGGLWRTAHALGADLIFTVGARYPRRQQTDTSDAKMHVPLWEFSDIDEFLAARPRDSKLVAVEMVPATTLHRFTHPERALYLLGAEDRGLSKDVMSKCDYIVNLPGILCLNVATTGSIVMYDRLAKSALRDAA